MERGYSAARYWITDGDGVGYPTECPSADACLDTDGDGTPDYLDDDDDNDGYPTFDECPEGEPCPDIDGDGIPEYLDAVDGLFLDGFEASVTKRLSQTPDFGAESKH